MANQPTRKGTIEDYVPLFKALCNSTRAQIIEFLLVGERCVCEMTGPLDLSQPLVSHHLGLLREAGLVTMRDEGARTYYSINWERFDADLAGFLAYVERLRNSPRPVRWRPGVGLRHEAEREAGRRPPRNIESCEGETMKFEILGSGCANCQKLVAITKEAVGDLAIGDAEVVKVTDMKDIMGYGVMSTPGLVIDGHVVSSGRVPSKAEVSVAHHDRPRRQRMTTLAEA